MMLKIMCWKIVTQVDFIVQPLFVSPIQMGIDATIHTIVKSRPRFLQVKCDAGVTKLT